MNKGVQTVFLTELERQATFALVAATDLEQALAQVSMDRIWYSVQALLVATGNLSKPLWPSQERILGRGQALRAVLGIEDSSPLAPRTFRNHFEHFDERLEAWAQSSTRHNFVDSNVRPPGMIQGLDRGDYLRNYDTQHQAVTFRGDTYQLAPVIAAIRKLHAKAVAALDS